MSEIADRLSSALADRHRIDRAGQATLIGVQNVFQRMLYDRRMQR